MPKICSALRRYGNGQRAHVCYVNGIPFLGVRSITDTATHQGIENFERNCEQASERAAAVAMGILALLAQKP